MSEEKEKKGFFSRLVNGLTQTRDSPTVSKRRSVCFIIVWLVYRVCCRWVIRSSRSNSSRESFVETPTVRSTPGKRSK